MSFVNLLTILPTGVTSNQRGGAATTRVSRLWKMVLYVVEDVSEKLKL